ncbi:MAG: hypothetical protein ACOYXT_24475 [Bacteroidota bacterium]
MIFFDIDNTLADSWPSFLVPGWKSSNHRLSTLAIFTRMRRLILCLFRSPFNQIYFLSTRSYTSFFVTLHWLQANKIPITWNRLIITNTPEEKLIFIKSALKSHKHSEVYLIDDLSHNHERGQVIFYEDLIRKIETANIRYFGVNKIKVINKI